VRPAALGIARPALRAGSPQGGGPYPLDGPTGAAGWP
jgi:hypothetical protein